MLSVLKIRNLAIIEELELEFGGGLNVITGETGAGKSILLDALSLILGARTDVGLIKHGRDQLEVEALFHFPSKDLEPLGAIVDVITEDELIIRRVVHREGKSKITFNGQLITLSQLQSIGRMLCDISSQHEHHALTRKDAHLKLLDTYGKLDSAKAEYQQVYAEYQSLQKSIEKRQDEATRFQEREDLLRYHLEELEQIKPLGNELEKLEQEKRLLANRERIQQVTITGAELLMHAEDAVLGRLQKLSQLLLSGTQLDPRFTGYALRVQTSSIELEELARDLERHSVSWKAGELNSAADASDASVEEIENRIQSLKSLIKKHKCTEEALPLFFEQLKRDCSHASVFEDDLRKLEQEAVATKQRLSALAATLTQARIKHAVKLSKEISREFISLKMSDACISVDVSPVALGPDGGDNIEFLFSANAGEPPKSLAKIASGGELSRTLLAVKRVLAEASPKHLYVFDEVDSGVGGAVAEAIGKKIEQVSKHHQTICITHLPQIAVYGDHHFFVSKSSKKTHTGLQTTNAITKLTSSERVDEIARMLSGETITEKTRGAARELLTLGSEFKIKSSKLKKAA